ncbi:MAG: M20 family metallopeptidase [Allobaculum sp.]|nr:M20 family metallopeptidase [Allobaculum sp.]
MSSLEEKIIQIAHDKSLPYQDLALQIHQKPEVSNYEFFASEVLSQALKEEGFEIELPAAGHRTGFVARYKSPLPGPIVVFLAEYDALVGLGHGCGHNLYGAASCLAGATLKEIIDEIGGEIRVYGTPGEEGGEKGSAKGSFVQKGYLEDVDFAIGVHPSGRPTHSLSSRNFSCAPIDIEFHGKSAHAAGCPEEGINALDAQIMVYNAISVLRQQLPNTVRIHGIITQGGTAPNVIPDFTQSKYYLRAQDPATLQDVWEKVQNIVNGVALATGCQGSMELYQNLVENMVLTPKFDALFASILESLGEEVEPQTFKAAPGSSDVGNISQVVPTIQPCLSISDHPIAGHSSDMVAASCSSKGLEFVSLAAKASALSALKLFLDPILLEEIKKEHAWNVTHQKESFF